MITGIPRHEAWRKMYRENRYCRHLSQKELNQRVRDLLLNMLRVTPEAKIGLPPLESEGVKAIEIWTHVLEEMVLRHRPYPNGFSRDILHSEPFPDLVGELGTKAAGILASALDSSQAVVDQFEIAIEQLRITCFCTGSSDLSALRHARLVSEAPGNPAITTKDGA